MPGISLWDERPSLRGVCARTGAANRGRVTPSARGLNSGSWWVKMPRRLGRIAQALSYRTTTGPTRLRSRREGDAWPGFDSELGDLRPRNVDGATSSGTGREPRQPVFAERPTQEQ